MTSKYPPLTVEVEGTRITVFGRDAWALRELIGARAQGCTPIDNPAPRWSAYVHSLRNAGFEIETLHERHGGNFPGTHARYILRCHVRVIPEAA